MVEAAQPCTSCRSDIWKVSSLLFGVEPLDPVTFGSAILVLLLTAALAAAAPALRAARVDPVEAFRQD